MDQPTTSTPVQPFVPAKSPRWPWFVGVLVPIVCGAIWIASQGLLPVGSTSFVVAYLGALTTVLLLAALAPILLGIYLHIPWLGISVAGFGLPSPLGLLFSALLWALVGRGMYALYHSYLGRIVFWLILFAALVALLVGAYMGTNDFRALQEARATGSTASCDQFTGDDQFVVEKRGYCLIEAAVAANDPTMCENIPGWQRTACYNRLNAPYTPLPGMK